MLDALNRADRYRDLAEGCRRLAAIGFSDETRNHYLRMAEQIRYNRRSPCALDRKQFAHC